MAGRLIQSLQRADAILEAIAAAPDGQVRLADIQRATGLHKNTAYSLLATLEELRYVERGQGEPRYRLGLRVLQLGRQMDRQFDLVGLLRPSLVRLCRATGETVNFAVPYANDALVVSSLEGAYSVRATSYVGWRIYYHASALGKSMLAHYDEAHRKAILHEVALRSYTANTITDPAALHAELEMIRARGHAFDHEEYEAGANAVAVPLLDSHGEPLGAISVSGPTSRLDDATLKAIARLIAAEIEDLRGDLP